MINTGHVRLILLVSIIFALGACRTVSPAEVYDENLTTAGISTEHPLSGVSQTACGWKVEDIKKLHQSKIYYVAVPEAMFQGGKNCGRIVEVKIGGACYENHDSGCIKADGHASLADFEKATKKAPPPNTAKLFIADSCGSCLNDAGSPHLDITNEVFVAPAPLANIRTYFTTHVQAVKQSATSKTSQPNNLFLSEIKLADCAPGLTFQSWVVKGHCNKGGESEAPAEKKSAENKPADTFTRNGIPYNNPSNELKGPSGNPYCGEKIYGTIYQCGPSKCSKSDPEYKNMCELRYGS